MVWVPPIYLINLLEPPGPLVLAFEANSKPTVSHPSIIMVHVFGTSFLNTVGDEAYWVIQVRYQWVTDVGT